MYLAKWLREGAPLGIEKTIETCGIFPLTPQECKAEEVVTDYESFAWNFKNFTSYAENEACERRVGE